MHAFDDGNKVIAGSGSGLAELHCDTLFFYVPWGRLHICKPSNSSVAGRGSVHSRYSSALFWDG